MSQTKTEPLMIDPRANGLIGILEDIKREASRLSSKSGKQILSSESCQQIREDIERLVESALSICTQGISIQKVMISPKGAPQHAQNLTGKDLLVYAEVRGWSIRIDELNRFSFQKDKWNLFCHTPTVPSDFRCRLDHETGLSVEVTTKRHQPWNGEKIESKTCRKLIALMDEANEIIEKL